MKEFKELPAGWQWVKIKEVCEINPRRPSLDRNDLTPTTFVPMVAVDELTGTITVPNLRPFGEVKKGYTYFEEGDILFSKITPCMENGKHTIAHHLIDGIGFGTTEFHVLRPSKLICAEWLHFYLRQPEILHEATIHFTGAVGQQRVPPKFLAELEIPLPPLHEQHRIAALLTEQLAVVEQARKATKVQLAAINDLPAALLRHAFTGSI